MCFAARGKSRLALSVITMRAQRWQLLGANDRPVVRQPNHFTITPSNRDTWPAARPCRGGAWRCEFGICAVIGTPGHSQRAVTSSGRCAVTSRGYIVRPTPSHPHLSGLCGQALPQGALNARSMAATPKNMKAITSNAHPKNAANRYV
jgi:hypothetical protein